MQTLSGNIQGLSTAEKKSLERIWRRRVDPRAIVTPELATYLCECAHAIQRQVGEKLSFVETGRSFEVAGFARFSDAAQPARIHELNISQCDRIVVSYQHMVYRFPEIAAQ